MSAAASIVAVSRALRTEQCRTHGTPWYTNRVRPQSARTAASTTSIACGAAAAGAAGAGSGGASERELSGPQGGRRC